MSEVITEKPHQDSSFCHTEMSHEIIENKSPNHVCHVPAAVDANKCYSEKRQAELEHLSGRSYYLE